MKGRLCWLVALAISNFVSLTLRADDNDRPLDQHQQTLQAVRDYHEAEARMEKAFNAHLAATQNAADRKDLIASQKAWVKYRDAVIYSETPDKNEDWGSGTNERLHAIAKELTEERTHFLMIEF